MEIYAMELDLAEEVQRQRTNFFTFLDFENSGNLRKCY